MRSKYINTINGKIQKALDRIESIDRKKNLLINELSALQRERETVLTANVMNALKKSGKSYEELMIFLGGKIFSLQTLGSYHRCFGKARTFIMVRI